MRKQFEAIWEYVVEIILSTAILDLLNQLKGTEVLRGWLVHKRTDLINLLVVAAAATAVTFGAFFAVLTTEFGLRLRQFGEAKAYSTALGYPLLLFVVTLALLTLGPAGEGTKYDDFLIFLLIYSAVNLFTMIKNVIGLVSLWQDVDRARKTGKR